MVSESAEGNDHKTQCHEELEGTSVLWIVPIEQIGHTYSKTFSLFTQNGLNGNHGWAVLEHQTFRNH